MEGSTAEETVSAYKELRSRVIEPFIVVGSTPLEVADAYTLERPRVIEPFTVVGLTPELAASAGTREQSTVTPPTAAAVKTCGYACILSHGFAAVSLHLK